MISVKPFKAVRPTRDKAYLVATRSYVSYSNKELEDKLNNNPFTFFHVISPDKEQSMSGTEKFKQVRSKFDEFCKEKVFINEDKKAIYIYQQQTPTHVFTGIIGAVSTEDYKAGKIKKHEHTITHRENLFAEYLKETGFNAEPVLLMHKPLTNLEEVQSKYMNKRAEYEFTSTDKNLHLLWPVTDSKDIVTITDAFKSVNELYIADGHHRCASSARLAEIGDSKNDLNKDFMAFLIPENNIKLQEFNRVSKTLNGLSKDDFLKAIEKDFFVKYINQPSFTPTALHEIGLYIDGDWYALFAKPGTYNSEDPVDQLDCKIISDNILDKILGIKDERQDPNLDFLPGVHGMEAVMDKVDNHGFKIGLSLFPVSIEQLKNVADAGMFMPPKSTYIEPKLRSGLTIYKFK